ncbi:hypothetical protein L1049_000400 [Liquidambar formosana]|uniref:VQ domain-containing protein n=1 Tax=Liquidambar formosana TaxID=63359 RepID=A0AAP0N9N7_LIQFO
MESTSKPQERENPSPINSPNSNGSTSMSSTNSNNNGVIQAQTPPLTPKPMSSSRSDTNPYPTTFVQADTTTFKQVVQMLTGSSETAKQASKPSPDFPPSSSNKSFIPSIKAAPKKQPGFKLYERRNHLKNSLMINPLVPRIVHNSGFSPRNTEILSPSLLDFPKLALSPVTPLNEDPFDKSSPSVASSSEEEKAIAEKGFYLHPSPITTPRESEPQLLPLFPVSSPRVSGSSS